MHKCKKNICEKNKSFKRGFSLVEVLVTLMVLSIGMAAVSALMVGNIKSSDTAKNQIVASKLAEEGIELVRNMKDNKQLDGGSAPYDYTIGSGAGGVNPITYSGLKIDQTLSLFNDTGTGQLYIDNTSNFYVHSSSNGNKATKYYRVIDLTVTGDMNVIPDSTRQLKVTSYVSWNAAGIPANCKIGNKCVSVVSVMPDLN